MIRSPHHRLAILGAVAAALYCAAPLVLADTTRLQGLLDSIPAGGWVEVNTNTFSSAWPSGSVAVPGAGASPLGVLNAWSSVAWDSTSSQLLVWGGGHANYAGNEMYLWDAATGAWSLGSVPSKLYNGGDANFFVVDSAAPQSAHTYDNNLYLPVNNMFMTFGGAVYNTGANFATATCTSNFNCSDVQRAGPWLWDPTKADGTKVGGTTGSGYDPNTLGGNMWLNRAGTLTGAQGPTYQNGATANRVELISGVATDVVYLTSDSQGSGFPGLYRYVLGDVRSGGTDTMTKIGFTNNTLIQQGAATLDTTHNLFIRTTDYNGTLVGAAQPDFAVWMLSRADSPGTNIDIPVRLVLADGSDFTISRNVGIDYDAADDVYLLYDGSSPGLVWVVKGSFDAQGVPHPTWLVTPVASTTGQMPDGNYTTGVLGKWHYISELDAYLAVDQYSNATGDAGVWLYKPLAAAVPEAGSLWMWCVGLPLVGLWRRRQTLHAA